MDISKVIPTIIENGKKRGYNIQVTAPILDGYYIFDAISITWDYHSKVSISVADVLNAYSDIDSFMEFLFNGIFNSTCVYAHNAPSKKTILTLNQYMDNMDFVENSKYIIEPLRSALTQKNLIVNNINYDKHANKIFVSVSDDCGRSHVAIIELNELDSNIDWWVARFVNEAIQAIEYDGEQ